MAPDGLSIEKWQVRLPAVPLSCNDSGQVVHTRVPLSLVMSKGSDALQLRKITVGLAKK